MARPVRSSQPHKRIAQQLPLSNVGNHVFRVIAGEFERLRNTGRAAHERFMLDGVTVVNRAPIRQSRATSHPRYQQVETEALGGYVAPRDVRSSVVFLRWRL